jgi:PAS domain S-box-containing protein
MFENNRILVVDDNELIHEDFRKILLNSELNTQENKYMDLEKELFGSTSSNLTIPSINYSIDFAFQGEDAYEMVKNAERNNKPYALIFMDVRMPPGWDGIETISKIWRKYSNIEVVICSAYSDYSWDKIIGRLGSNDRLIFLKKPFDSVEVKQLALALVKKWNLYEKSKNYVSDLEREVSKRTRQLKGMVQELVTSRDKLKKEVFVRKSAEEDLSTEKDNLSFLLKNMPDAVLSIDVDGKINLINSTFENLINMKRESIVNKYINDILTFYDLDDSIVMYKNINSSSCNNKILKLRSNNIDKTVIVSCARICDKNSIEKGLVILIKDISEKLKMEEDLIRTKNLESVSTFAEGIAYDFENIISRIVGNITLSKNLIGDNTKAREYLDIAEKDSIKVMTLSQQLRTLSNESNENLDFKIDNIVKKNKVICVLSNENSIKRALENTIKNLGYSIHFEKNKEKDLTILDEDVLNTNDFDYDSKIILLSMYNKNILKEKYPNLTFFDVLEKPFKLKDISFVLKNSL